MHTFTVEFFCLACTFPAVEETLATDCLSGVFTIRFGIHFSLSRHVCMNFSKKD